MAVWSAITRITTFDLGVTPAAGQCGDPHRQARVSLPSAIAPAASERRSPALRGSSAHSPLTIAVTRCFITAAAGASSCPNTDTVSVSSSHAPMMKSRPRTTVSVRRCASGSYRATCASTATRSLSSDSRSHLTARSAIAASMLAHASLALHQPSAPGDRGDQPGTQRALAVQRRNLGQVLAQRLGDTHLPRGAPRPDRHRRSHLSGRRIPRIERPQRALVVGLDPTRGSTRRSRPTAAHRRSPPAAPRPRSRPQAPHRLAAANTESNIRSTLVEPSDTNLTLSPAPSSTRYEHKTCGNRRPTRRADAGRRRRCADRRVLPPSLVSPVHRHLRTARRRGRRRRC